MTSLGMLFCGILIEISIFHTLYLFILIYSLRTCKGKFLKTRRLILPVENRGGYVPPLLFLEHFP